MEKNVSMYAGCWGNPNVTWRIKRKGLGSEFAARVSLASSNVDYDFIFSLPTQSFVHCTHCPGHCVSFVPFNSSNSLLFSFYSPMRLMFQ